MTGSITINSEGISGNVGGGLGIGFGAAVTGDLTFGSVTGWNGSFGVSGGDVVGVQASASAGLDKSTQLSAGAGLGVGAGATLTAGYTGQIYTFEEPEGDAKGCDCD